MKKKIKKNKINRTPRAKGPSKDDIALYRRALELLEMLGRAKELYRQVDEITNVLLERGFTAVEIDGNVLQMVDNFGEKNLAWKSSPFRRFDLRYEPAKPKREIFRVRSKS